MSATTYHNVGDYLNKALTGIETANASLYDVLQHIDFTRKVGQSKIPDIKLRQLITHFGAYRLRCATRISSSLTCWARPMNT